MVPGAGGAGPLRAHLEAEAAKAGCSMKDLTVLASHRDPFRIDTPAHHRDSAWLARTVRELIGDRKINVRGLHYKLLGVPKPDGTPYANTDKAHKWLGAKVAVARWLGYIRFDQIEDHRSAAPIVRPFEPANPEPKLKVDLDIKVPEVADLLPKATLLGFPATQRYRLVVFGEKSDLADALGPIANTYHADLYLSAGEISDTLIYHMAKVGADDGRPMVVVCFSDCDPAGWQMPISIGRKLQAFQTLAFPDLHFQVRPVALTPDQVREYGLPSIPLKPGEKRADAWQAAMGTAQTEIDSFIGREPEQFRRAARAALDPFFDKTLARRVNAVADEWEAAAQAAVDAQVGEAHREHLHAEATERLRSIRAQLDEIAAMQIDPTGFDLPEVPAVPEPDLDGRVDGKPLVDSTWEFAAQCRRMIDAKAYQDGEGDDPADDS